MRRPAGVRIRSEYAVVALVVVGVVQHRRRRNERGYEGQLPLSRRLFEPAVRRAQRIAEQQRVDE